MARYKRQLKAHQIHFEAHPPLRNRALTISRWKPNSWRVGSERVQRQRHLPDGGVAWTTSRTEPYSWLLFTPAEWLLLQALPVLQTKPQPPPQPSVAPEAFTLQFIPWGEDQPLVLQRFTDSLFVALKSGVQHLVILSFTRVNAQLVELQTADHCWWITADEYQQLMILPAWKTQLRAARKRDRFAQAMRSLIPSLVLEQVVPVVADGSQGDQQLAVRILQQIKLETSLPIDQLMQIRAPIPHFLREFGLPAILEPSPDHQVAGSLADDPAALPFDQAIAQWVAIVHEYRSRQRQLQIDDQQAALARQEHAQALRDQRDAALIRLTNRAAIEATFELLIYINRWAKAKDRLLYADRQGLYRLKTDLVSAAVHTGLISPAGYVEGDFAPFASVHPDLLGDSVWEYIQWAGDSGSGIDDGVRTLIRAGQHLAPSELAQRLGAYIVEQLAQLEALARQSRIAINSQQLHSLGLSPLDLPGLAITTGGWDGLDASQLGELDPEHRSLVIFSYQSATASFRFHQPYRVSETFLAPDLLDHLRRSPVQRREAGERFGRPINAAESLTHPIASLLEQLGMPVECYCPHYLLDKAIYIQHKQALRAMQDWDNQDYWEEME